MTNWLTEYTYAAEERKVIFHEVTWSPTTTVIKQKAFTNDQTLNRHRVLINRDLKTSLLDDSLSDAVLYLNPSFRSAMQEPILQTIDLVVPQIGPHDHIVLITASLGSKMTFDTVLATIPIMPPSNSSPNASATSSCSPTAAATAPRHRNEPGRGIAGGAGNRRQKIRADEPETSEEVG